MLTFNNLRCYGYDGTKPIVIAICGASASGKDTLQKAMCRSRTYVCHDMFSGNKIPVHGMVSCTTRPRRRYERNGYDYNFLNKTQFKHLQEWDEFLETSEFRGWQYGVLKSEVMSGVNIGVFNPEGLVSLLEYKDDYFIVPVYLNVGAGKRLVRSIRREGKFKWEYLRRMKTDHNDFKGIRDLLNQFDMSITCKNDRSTEESLDYVERRLGIEFSKFSF